LSGDNEIQLILASGSARRKELLRQAGFSFTVIVPSVEESPLPGESPERCAQRLARTKADAVAERVPPGRCVLAADTIVVLKGEPLGKPRDRSDAVTMLLRLAGCTHRVITGFAASRRGPRGKEECGGFEESRVRMRDVSREEAEGYAATGEPLDKAGAYAVQGLGGQFVEAVEGSRSNVIGLPLERVVPLLERLGIHPT
jgi:septum formation protein